MNRSPSRGFIVALVTFLLAACLAASTGRAETLLVPALTGRVVDEAQMIGSNVQSRLEEKLEQFEEKTGHQFVVVTLPSLRGYSIEEWGTALINQWGIGRASHNDGVALVVAPKERELRIEVGSGLEWELTDELAARIIQSVIVPKFKSGNLEGGVMAGADAIIAQLSGQSLELGEVRASRERSGINPGLIIFIIIVGFFIIAGVNLYRKGVSDHGQGGGFPYDNDDDDGWGLESRGPWRRSRDTNSRRSWSSSRSSGFRGGGGRSRGGGASGRW